MSSKRDASVVISITVGITAILIFSAFTLYEMNYRQIKEKITDTSVLKFAYGDTVSLTGFYRNCIGTIEDYHNLYIPKDKSDDNQDTYFYYVKAYCDTSKQSISIRAKEKDLKLLNNKEK